MSVSRDFEKARRYDASTRAHKCDGPVDLLPKLRHRLVPIPFLLQHAGGDIVVVPGHISSSRQGHHILCWVGASEHAKKANTRLQEHRSITEQGAERTDQ